MWSFYLSFPSNRNRNIGVPHRPRFFVACYVFNYFKKMECQFPGADVFLSVLLTAKFPGAYLLHEVGAPHVVPEKECVWLLT